MKVRVVIEYEFPDLELLTSLTEAAIEDGVANGVPSAFTPADGDTIHADSWEVRVES